MANSDHDQDPQEEPDFDNMFVRLVFMIIIALMISFVQTLLGLLTIGQFVIMLVNQRQPNEQLAEFGTTLGVWIAKAARYQTGASEVK